MKKIIPFKKEINFNTKISEITSISLEHKITSLREDTVSGEFIISGDYKIIEGSIIREKYNYTIPFDIALDSRYDIKNIKVDIDDFYYDVIEESKLKVAIDLLVDGIELEEEFTPEILKEDIIKEDLEDSTDDEENILERVEEVEQEINNEREEQMEEELEINIDNVNNNINQNINIFDNVDDNDTYTTYRIYFVKEDDTIEKILTKYNITKEDLSIYNDLTEIKLGDKLIIPTSNE